jgi:arylsulfatase A-like enzyme
MHAASVSRTADESRMWRIYMGMQSLLDHHVGRICETLDDLGVAEDTLLIYTADHGDYMGDHWLWSKGASHYDAAIRVPLIVRWPGRIPSGERRDSLQSLVDLAPTILRAAGLERPEGMQGLDQLAAWQNPAIPPPRAAALIDHRVERGLYVNTWVTDRYRLSIHSILAEQRDEAELYDLHEDPNELENLAASNSGDKLVRSLLQELIRHRMQLLDPWPQRSAFS